MNKGTAAPRAVYIHIPFCEKKCLYCDFNTYVRKGQPVESYLAALEREMELTVREHPPGRVETIFVGGGTPTELETEEMARFLAAVRRYFPADPETCEFTMEANPGTVDPGKLAVMREGGVNRISFGVQSFDNGLLRRLGRIHDADDARKSLELARTAGFVNISIDLMFGLPGQTIEILEKTIDEALALGLPHYSVYALKIEENTPFHALRRQNRLPLPDEESEAEMYELIMRRMKEAGYVQYEISNFARPGFESRHNTVYWRNESYYGIGAGAHGYVAGMRHENVRGVAEYIAAAQSGLPRRSTHAVSPEEMREDFMMVGLRLLEGVRRDDYRRRYGREMEDDFGEVLKRLAEKGLLAENEAGYRLTHKGIMFGNEVFGAFIGVLA